MISKNLKKLGLIAVIASGLVFASGAFANPHRHGHNFPHPRKHPATLSSQGVRTPVGYAAKKVTETKDPRGVSWR